MFAIAKLLKLWFVQLRTGEWRRRVQGDVSDLKEAEALMRAQSRASTVSTSWSAKRWNLGGAPI